MCVLSYIKLNINILKLVYLQSKYARYLFLFSGNETETLKVSSSGSRYGLKLTMSVEQEEYLGHDTFSAGLKIRVHHKDEPPLVNNLGFAAMPGAHVFAAISRTKVS